MKITVETIEKILKEILPEKYIRVKQNKNPVGGGEYIACEIARDQYQINGVARQYREHISFEIQDDKLRFFPFGGMGGNFIYRNIDPKIEGEKYYAMGHEKLKPKNFKDLEKYIKYIGEEYKRIIHNIHARGLAR